MTDDNRPNGTPTGKGVINRRKLLGVMGVGLGAGAVASLTTPAIASGKVEWRMVTSWPKNSAGPGVTAQRLAGRIADLSDGRMTVKLYSAGEMVPALETFDAVSKGTAEMAHTASLFWRGKMKTAPLFTAAPFGLTAIEHMGWIYHGGGQELWDELYAPFGVKPFMAGNTGMQMGGWFTREINSLADLKGFKHRIPGIGGEVFRKLGATPVVIAPGEIYQALQSGVVDGAEFLGPYSDMAFGFYKVAPYYYWPGFHEPNGTGEALVSKSAFEELTPELKAVVRNACMAENAYSLAEAEWENARALETLVTKDGVQLRAFPEDVIAAARKATEEVYGELRAEGGLTARIVDSYTAARKQSVRWGRIGTGAFLNARSG